jgi:salicylate hydroxylase
LAREWGVDFDSIEKETSLGNRFVSWKNELLCEVPFGDVEEKYGAPYYFIHRADLVNALRTAASKYPEQITIITDSRVVEYDYSKPAVRTERGQWYSGDLVISAEGIKSSVREAINGGPAEPEDTGDVAYRILVPAAPLLEDPKLRTLVTEPWATHWMGPEGHAVGYPLRGGKQFNIIVDITHRSDCGEPVGEDWKKSADNRELVERFKDGWCYPVQKLCGMTGEYVKWKLAELERPLTRWVHPGGKVALLGGKTT